MTQEERSRRFYKFMDTNHVARNAYQYAKGISFEELTKLVQKINYRAFGFQMIQMYYVVHDKEWRINLRNEVIPGKSFQPDQQEELTFAAPDPKGAMEKIYAYSVARGYLPQPTQ